MGAGMLAPIFQLLREPCLLPRIPKAFLQGAPRSRDFSPPAAGKYPSQCSQDGHAGGIFPCQPLESTLPSVRKTGMQAGFSPARRLKGLPKG